MKTFKEFIAEDRHKTKDYWIYRSPDGGKTWELLDDEPYGSAMRARERMNAMQKANNRAFKRGISKNHVKYKLVDTPRKK